MSDENEAQEREEVNGGELVYRVSDPSTVSIRAEGEGADAPLVIEGRMMPYNEWTLVDSAIETRSMGPFLERFAPGSLAKTMAERGSKIRALFEHGLDMFGRQAIASASDFRDESDGAYYTATLLRGLPELLVDGIRNGLYGSSVRFRPIQSLLVRKPRKSEHNPDGIPEVTRTEAFVSEFSITAFPVYASATAHLRSYTDEIAARQLLGQPEKLLEILQSRITEPQHSEREEPEELVPERSRSTQTTKDYLSEKEAGPEWLL